MADRDTNKCLNAMLEPDITDECTCGLLAVRSK